MRKVGLSRNVFIAELHVKWLNSLKSLEGTLLVREMPLKQDMSEPSTSSEPLITQKPDRRAFRRALLERPVLVETADAERPARGINVSGGGIILQTELELALGEAVDLDFELPVGYAVEARAVVVRRDRDQFALRFEDLAKESLVALRSFCRLSGLHQINR